MGIGQRDPPTLGCGALCAPGIRAAAPAVAADTHRFFSTDKLGFITDKFTETPQVFFYRQVVQNTEDPYSFSYRQVARFFIDLLLYMEVQQIGNTIGVKVKDKCKITL